MNWKETLRYGWGRMLYGRYGMDELGKFLWALVIIMLIVNLFVPNLILTAVMLVTIILMYARFFSKRYDRRRAENSAYLKLSGPFRRTFSTLYLRIRDRKSYRYYYCPDCRQRLRVPKGKGMITITCPKCHKKFDARS